MTREFILNTLLPYKENPATCAFGDNGCCYLTSDGRRCAVGKHMIEGEHQKIGTAISDTISFPDINAVLNADAVAQEIPVETWRQIQWYHDSIALSDTTESINRCVNKLEKMTGFQFPELKFN